MKNINKNEAQIYIYQSLHNQYRQGEYEWKTINEETELR